MKFERIRLENYKCYDQVDLRLDRGVTVIHGLNGSGKSSLLEACFFALYGHRALDQTLEDVVTIGAEETVVELWFTHGGDDFDYHVRRRVKVRSETAQTVECVLETPDGPVEGATDVRERIGELLRMDAEAFVNCAYVRQGEVNKLIDASPGERQDMIDDLLQLGKLEEYRERAKLARRGVGRVRDGREDVLREKEGQISTKEDEDLHDRLGGLKSELNEVSGNIEDKETQREKAIETRNWAEQILEEHAERQAEIEDLAGDIEGLEERITTTESEREATVERVRSLRETATELRADLSEALAATELDELGPETVTSAGPEPDSDEGGDQGGDGGAEAGSEPEVLPDDGSEALNERMAELEATDEELAERIQEAKLRAQRHEQEAESARESAADRRERAEAKLQEATELEEEIEEARTALETRRGKLEDVRNEIASKRAVFEDRPVEFGESEAHLADLTEQLDEVREAIADCRATLEAKRADVAEAEELLEAGKCPECGQPVEGAPHVEGVEDDRRRVADLEAELGELEADRDRIEDRVDRAETLVETETEVEQLETRREDVEELVAEKERSLDEKAESVDTLRETAEQLESEAADREEEAEEAAATAAECREEVEELTDRRATVDERIERLEDVQERLETIGEIESDVERLRDERDHKEDLLDQYRSQLQEKRERKRELESTFDEERVEHARDEKARAEDYLEQVDPTLADLREHRDELQGAIGAVENELEELESLRERRDELERTVEHLDSLYDETGRLQEMYRNLRDDLRQRNVDKLERLLNETFELLYQNDSYARIELDGEYDLTVYQKDGEPLDPEQLSGGERALFNLSLRCAVYRLLAEGIEGAAPMPPLILDEPTVFLDAGHVSQLVDLVEAMRAVGVEQIVVVSHDEDLVGAADDLVRVQKDPTSNRSTVERDVEAVAAAD